jgi:glycosyltransferase involved in cell wall biosynthesis
MRTVVPPPRGKIEPAAQPSFAVVVPVFNAAATVADAVRSALEQTMPAQEVIVVDDGSTDDLLDALTPFDGSITLVRQENRGVGSARNAGVRVARADFVAFLDADDAYHAHRLEALAALAVDRPDLDILTTDTLFLVDGEAAGRYHTTHPFPVADQRTAILRTCFTFGCPAIRRTRLLEVGGFAEDLRTGSDWDCIARLILGGSSAGLVDEPLLEYRIRPDSLTSDRVGALWSRVHMLERLGETFDLDENEKAELSRSLVHHLNRAVLAEAWTRLEADKVERRGLIALASRRRLPLKTRTQLAVLALAPHIARGWIPTDRGPLHQRLSRRD